jgi:hypothetical protein
MNSFKTRQILVRNIFYCLVLLLPLGVSAQEYKLLLDTIYPSASFSLGMDVKALAVDDEFVLFNKDTFVVYDGVEDFRVLGDMLTNSIAGSLLKKSGVTYRLGNTLSLKPEGGLGFNLSDIPKGASFEIQENSIVYRHNDSIFFKHSSWEEFQFVGDEGRPELVSRDHLIINDSYAYSFYSLKENKLLSITTEGIHSGGTDSLIIMSKRDEDARRSVAVLDHNLKTIVAYERGFTELHAFDGFEVVTLINRKAKIAMIIRNPADITVLQNVTDLEPTSNRDLFILTEPSGQEYFVDKYGKRLSEESYSSIFDWSRYGFFKAKRGGKCYVLTTSGREVFSGEYKDIFQTSPNRFKVRVGHQIAVVDSTGIVIIPFRIGDMSSITTRTVFGPELFLIDASMTYRKVDREMGRKADSVNVFSSDGELLLAWNPSEEVDHVDINFPTFWDFGLEAISKLPREKVLKLNPNNVWRISRGKGRAETCRLIRHDGTPITAWLKDILFTDVANQFVIRSKEGHYGLIEVANK